MARRPLRENVAAGILLRAQWPQIAAAGGEFLDPMCGSGTFVIEAAWIAANIAPGLMREYFGFLGWRGHDAALWAGCATTRSRGCCSNYPWSIRGTDRSAAAVATATANARRAGVGRDIRFEQSDLAGGASGKVVEPTGRSFGLMCVNPPYGQRIGQGPEALEAHRAIGVALRERFQGWQAAVLTGDPALGPGDRHQCASRTHRVQWRDRVPAAAILSRASASSGGRLRAASSSTTRRLAEQWRANVRQPSAKNIQQLGKQARREQVSCLRVYDADMPEYALAIDLYAGGRRGRRGSAGCSSRNTRRQRPWTL